MVLKDEYQGDLYLAGKRPRYVAEWLDEAILQLEAGDQALAALCLAFLHGQSEVNRDWAYRNKAAR